MRLMWTDGALSDWNGIAQYIAVNFGKKAFDDYDKATDEAEVQIRENPGSGYHLRKRKYPNLGLKLVLVGKLSKMIYHTDGDQVIVDVIWDTRQSPKRLTQRLSKI